jgi:zeaxanthin epoxidase
MQLKANSLAKQGRTTQSVSASVCKPSISRCINRSNLSTARVAQGVNSRDCRIPLMNVVASAASVAEAFVTNEETRDVAVPMNILIAGGGIGGLVLALNLLKKGFKVTILEKDLTAVRGEGKYRGPIQVQSNALAALEAIDQDVADEILASGCITGDRINGLVDGASGKWYVKFDTFHPAVDRGLPVTRVISRILLQQILCRAVEKYGGPNVIQAGLTVKNFDEYEDKETRRNKVDAIMSDGSRISADLLVGADGIWSKVRTALIGTTQPNYSEYTCYTGISDFTPADIDVVGYRVFLGNGQYFVSSDVGNGKMQWYAFNKEPQGGKDVPGTLKFRLLSLFGHWCDDVTDLIKATPEPDVLRRDIFDRPPIFQWAKGRVVLLGDSAHAMQPNLGQGGCMAIEDAYQLGMDLDKAMQTAGGDANKVNVDAVTLKYQLERVVRASAIHGMAGMAAFMASTYKGYLGEGLGPLSWITKYKIPHPGRVAGQVVMKLTMPGVLGWVLGGNCDNLAQTRAGVCRISDKPHGFNESDFGIFMNSDEEIIK